MINLRLHSELHKIQVSQRLSGMSFLKDDSVGKFLIPLVLFSANASPSQ